MSHINDIIQHGLCIGCGLCESLAGKDQIEMVMTKAGRERPLVKTEIDTETVEKVYATCPGTEIHGLPEGLLTPETTVDPIWGADHPHRSGVCG